MDTNNEAFRAECMARLKKTVAEWLLIDDEQEKRRTYSAFLAQHGEARAKEVAGVVKAINAGKIKLDQLR